MLVFSLFVLFVIVITLRYELNKKPKSSKSAFFESDFDDIGGKVILHVTFVHQNIFSNT